MVWHGIVRLAIILASLQCIRAGVVRHFNAKRHSEDLEYFFEKHRSRSDNHIELDELPQLRARRQGMGGQPPERFSSILPNDTSQFGRVSYSGEGSKVWCNSSTYSYQDMRSLYSGRYHEEFDKAFITLCLTVGYYSGHVVYAFCDL